MVTPYRHHVVLFFALIISLLFMAITTHAATNIIQPTAEHPVLYASATTDIQAIPPYPDPEDHFYTLGFTFDNLEYAGKIQEIRCVLYDAGYNSTILSSLNSSDIKTTGTYSEFPEHTRFIWGKGGMPYSALVTLRCAVYFSELPVLKNSAYLPTVEFVIQQSQPNLAFWPIIKKVQFGVEDKWNDINPLASTITKQTTAYLSGQPTPAKLLPSYADASIISRDEFKPLHWSFVIDNAGAPEKIVNEMHTNVINTLRIRTVSRGWIAQQSIGTRSAVCYINGIPLLAQLNDNFEEQAIWINFAQEYAGKTNGQRLIQALYPAMFYIHPDNLQEFANAQPAHILTFDCGLSFPIVLPHKIDQKRDLWAERFGFVVETPIYPADIAVVVDFGLVDYTTQTPLLRDFEPSRGLPKAHAHIGTTNPSIPTPLNADSPQPAVDDTASTIVGGAAVFATTPYQQYDQIACAAPITFPQRGIQPYLRQSNEDAVTNYETVTITIPKLDFKIANGNFNNLYAKDSGEDHIIDKDALIRGTMIQFTLDLDDTQVASVMVTPSADDWVYGDDYIQITSVYSTAKFFPGKTIEDIKAKWGNRTDDITLSIELFMYGYLNRTNPSGFVNTTQCIFEYRHSQHTKDATSITHVAVPLPLSFIHQYTVGNNVTEAAVDKSGILELQYSAKTSNNNEVLLRTINHNATYHIAKVWGSWASPFYVQPNTLGKSNSRYTLPNTQSTPPVPRQYIYNIHTPTQRNVEYGYLFTSPVQLYAVEHVAYQHDWQGGDFNKIEQVVNQWMLSDDPLNNVTKRALTLKHAPIVWKQTVTLFTDEKLHNETQISIPMMIAFQGTAQRDYDIASTIGRKPPVKIPNGPTSDDDGNHKKGGGNNKALYLFIALVILFACLAVAAWLYFKRKNAKRAQNDGLLIDDLGSDYNEIR